MNDYTIPKPGYPIFLKLLTGLVITGLLGLGIVAYETFNLVHGPLVAGIFAIVIEVGAAIDSVGLAGGINKRSWWLVPAILITITVSGWYNFATVDKGAAALGIEDKNMLSWVEHAIAWGPLASLAFMALGVGFRISDHEREVKAWEVARQTWQDDQDRKAEQARNDQETRRMQLEYQKEKLRLENEARIELARAEEERKAQVAKARIEAKERLRQIATNVANAPQMPIYSRGYDGFVEYIHWLESQERTFDKTAAAKEMGRSIRQIERYIEEGRSNGIAESIGKAG